jgi:hypothetical protein
MRVGFLIHMYFFFSETRAEGLLIPVSSFCQVMAFFSWALVVTQPVLSAAITMTRTQFMASPFRWGSGSFGRNSYEVK